MSATVTASAFSHHQFYSTPPYQYPLPPGATTVPLSSGSAAVEIQNGASNARFPGARRLSANPSYARRMSGSGATSLGHYAAANNAGSSWKNSLGTSFNGYKHSTTGQQFFGELARSLTNGSFKDLPHFEAEFCRDFRCCGLVLNDLHELVTHWEEQHQMESGYDGNPVAAALARATGTSHGGPIAAASGMWDMDVEMDLDGDDMYMGLDEGKVYGGEGYDDSMVTDGDDGVVFFGSAEMGDVTPEELHHTPSPPDRHVPPRHPHHEHPNAIRSNSGFLHRTLGQLVPGHDSDAHIDSDSDMHVASQRHSVSPPRGVASDDNQDDDVEGIGSVKQLPPSPPLGIAPALVQGVPSPSPERVAGAAGGLLGDSSRTVKLEPAVVPTRRSERRRAGSPRIVVDEEDDDDEFEEGWEEGWEDSFSGQIGEEDVEEEEEEFMMEDDAETPKPKKRINGSSQGVQAAVSNRGVARGGLRSGPTSISSTSRRQPPVGRDAEMNRSDIEEDNEEDFDEEDEEELLEEDEDELDVDGSGVDVSPMRPGTGLGGGTNIRHAARVVRRNMVSGEEEEYIMEGRGIVKGVKGDRKYICAHAGCDKVYKNPGGLKYHLAHGHPDPTKSTIPAGLLGRNGKRGRNVPDIYKPYRCCIETCGKRYKNLNGLKYHLEHHHSDEIPLTTDKDGKPKWDLSSCYDPLVLPPPAPVPLPASGIAAGDDTPIRTSSPTISTPRSVTGTVTGVQTVRMGSASTGRGLAMGARQAPRSTPASGLNKLPMQGGIGGSTKMGEGKSATQSSQQTAVALQKAAAQLFSHFQQQFQSNPQAAAAILQQQQQLLVQLGTPQPGTAPTTNVHSSPASSAPASASNVANLQQLFADASAVIAQATQASEGAHAKVGQQGADLKDLRKQMVNSGQGQGQGEVVKKGISAGSAPSQPARGITTRKSLFTKILIANRGEIACRVIRTCRRLGVRTVAVYSEADKDSMHVKLADEAYLIGPAPSAESYLRADRIIDVCKKSGAQAIHPGYGFLSENADFADTIAKAGLVFIGPPSSAIRDMGSKSASKHLMEAADVPVVPGYHGDDQDSATLLSAAQKIGFPVIIKAVKGGGGKGMRIVEREADFDGQLQSAMREAQRSFGDGRVLVEKYLTKPRHVELQVFADSHGNVVHLFERDCSVQRRHQKVIEEAPAPSLPAALRARMGTSAVAAARAVGYRGAGTVEFILDADSLKSENEDDWRYYFMEMNTRLQVEHPVTEMITGTDLVEWQLEVASGNPLPMLQEDIKVKGHAFETRIYAEDPDNNFYPSPGPLFHLKFPEPNPYLRVETGVQQGDSVGVFYDPMIAKLVTWGRDRDEALRRMEDALRETLVVGPGTNVEFLRRLCRNSGFIDADLDTGFISAHKADLLPPPNELPDMEHVVAATVGILASEGALPEKRHQDPWKAYAGFGVNYSGYRRVDMGWGPELENVGRRKGHAEIHFGGGGQEDFTVKMFYQSSKEPVTVVPRVTIISRTTTTTAISTAVSAFTTQMTLDFQPSNPTEVSRILTCTAVVIPEGESEGSATVFVNGNSYQFSLPVPEYLGNAHKMEAAGSVKAPMPCRIISISVKEGDKIEKGSTLVVLEAMKMEHVLRAPHSGVVKKVNFKVGDQVSEGRHILVLEDEGEIPKDVKQ
ncbi:Methylcrotonoyl-CoA carboxylase subunit alpha, mitochondrial [Gonapodya sp. JEL0774]|nr:Methylcrotonoyl-CoA carboxylase subunit alpha, mitochondrial [Gonapodya sp. JEL0774]